MQQIREEIDTIGMELANAYQLYGAENQKGSRPPNLSELGNSSLHTRSTRYSTIATVAFKDQKSGRRIDWNLKMNSLEIPGIAAKAEKYEKLQRELHAAEKSEQKQSRTVFKSTPNSGLSVALSNLPQERAARAALEEFQLRANQNLDLRGLIAPLRQQLAIDDLPIVDLVSSIVQTVRDLVYKTGLKSSTKRRTGRESESERIDNANRELNRMRAAPNVLASSLTGGAHNCAELAAIASVLLRTLNLSAGIHKFSADHTVAFCCKGPRPHLPEKLEEWPNHVLIVDPWANVVANGHDYPRLFQEKMNKWAAEGKEVRSNLGQWVLANDPRWVDAITSAGVSSPALEHGPSRTSWLP